MTGRNIIIFIVVFILLILSRLFTDIPNFTSTISIIIFLSYFIRNIAFSSVIVLSSQIFTDIFFGFYNSILFVYGSYILICLFSTLTLKSLNNRLIFIASIAGPTIFYIVSNFGVWLLDNIYTRDLNGLVDCYIAGIPFYKSSMISTIKG